MTMSQTQPCGAHEICKGHEGDILAIQREVCTRSDNGHRPQEGLSGEHCLWEGFPVC
jgi:hypothetical protein